MAVSRHTCYPGQILWIRATKGKVLGKVIKVNPKNIKLVTEDGSRYNAHPSFLDTPTPAEADAWDSGSTGYSPLAPSTTLHMGQVVRFKHPGVSKYEGLWVVCGAHAGSYRVARLGGDRGKYIRGVDATSVEVVNFELAGV